MIIWNGKKLSQKKKRQTQAAVKARVCADGSFWLVARRVNNLRYIQKVKKTLLRHLKKNKTKGKMELLRNL